MTFDQLPRHQRKPSNTDWIEWGVTNAARCDHSFLGWVRDNPQLFQSFEDVQSPDENPYIYHPRAQPD